MPLAQPTPEEPLESPKRRLFLQGLAVAPLLAASCGRESAPTPTTPRTFTSPISDDFQFIRQKVENGQLLKDSNGNPVPDENVNHFKDIEGALGKQPFTLSFITSLCTAPVDDEMLCDKMGRALAAISTKTPAMKHVVISVVPEGDYHGGLWKSLQNKGLNPENTIVLFPTRDGTVKGFPSSSDGSLLAALQNKLELSNDTNKNPFFHNSAISYYDAFGKQCNRKIWLDALSESNIPSSCQAR